MHASFPEYVVKAVEQAKVQELTDKYAAQGYEVQRNGSGAATFDLVMKHVATGHVVAFEVAVAPISDDDLARIERARQAAKEFGYSFRMITIVRPATPRIELDWLQDRFLEYLLEHVPEELKEKATHVRIVDAGILVTSIEIAEHRAEVLAGGSIGVEQQYGSDSDVAGDVGLVVNEEFPFTAELSLDLATQSILAAHIDIDESAFY